MFSSFLKKILTLKGKMDKQRRYEAKCTDKKDREEVKA